MSYKPNWTKLEREHLATAQELYDSQVTYSEGEAMSNTVDSDRHSNCRDMLEELLDLEDGLSGWEVEFIENLFHWDGTFTPRQALKIESIYERLC